jgi:acetyltransferase-like isoleucine patch superfamily enzyme
VTDEPSGVGDHVSPAELTGRLVTPSAPTVEPGVHLAYVSGRCPDRTLTLGAGAHIRTGSVLYAGTTIGDGLATGHNVVIREECRLGNDVAVWSNSVIDYGCVIGDRVKIHTNCYVAQFTVLEDDAFLAPGVSVANDLYPGDAESAERMRGPVIEAGAQIGVNVTLLPMVRVGAGAIIGSGSVVTRDIAPGMVAFGNPAREHRPVAELPPIENRVPPRS